MSRILVTPRSLARDPDPALRWLAGVVSVSPRVPEAAPGLRVISRNGTGTANLPLDTVQRLGIQMLWVDGAKARGVAELAVGRFAWRPLREDDREVAAGRSGRWHRVGLSGAGWVRAAAWPPRVGQMMLTDDETEDGSRGGGSRRGTRMDHDRPEGASSGRNVPELILVRLPELRKSDRRVAEHVFSDPQAALVATVAETARKAGVSEPTVMRFCAALGFEESRTSSSSWRIAWRLAFQRRNRCSTRPTRRRY